jgi:hypothetical protein
MDQPYPVPAVLQTERSGVVRAPPITEGAALERFGPLNEEKVYRANRRMISLPRLPLGVARATIPSTAARWYGPATPGRRVYSGVISATIFSADM